MFNSFVAAAAGTPRRQLPGAGDSETPADRHDGGEASFANRTTATAPHPSAAARTALAHSVPGAKVAHVASSLSRRHYSLAWLRPDARMQLQLSTAVALAYTERELDARSLEILPRAAAWKWN